MTTHIAFRGMDTSPALTARIQRWVDKLTAVDPDIQRCDVTVDAPVHHGAKRFHVRVEILRPGGTVVVSHDPGDDAGHRNAYVAVRDSFRAAQRQVGDH